MMALPIAGVDFDDGFGASNDIPDDLNTADSVTVSAGWTFPGTTNGGIIQGDANADAGRDSAPLVKFNGPGGNNILQPAVGEAPPTDGIHSFSIDIGDDLMTLTRVSFDFSAATGSTNVRWMAFRTSLDPNIIYSEVGPARPALTSAVIDLAGAQYAGLQNQTVEFIWYCGGQGSGDMDVDSIVIEGIEDIPSDTDADGLPDSFEQLIIDADPDDAIETIEDVLPGDDFDSDFASNLSEYDNRTNPVNSDSDTDGLLDGVETNTDVFVSAMDTGTDPLDADSDDDGLEDGVETNDMSFDDIATDTGTNPNEADSDSDQIPDGYEVNNGLNPFVDDSGADPDDDSSTNLEEFANGTFVDNPDSDDDGLKDGFETNTGTHVSAMDTGTDPLNPDTDGDNLLDGVESNDATFDGPGDTGSDPHNANTDGDNFRDGAEVIYHGTDPSDGNSFPPTEKTVLFLAAGDAGAGLGTIGADEVAVELLEDKFGIDKVTIENSTLFVPGSEVGFDLMLFSSTPGSGDFRGKYLDSPVPIVNWEEAISDNGAGEFGATTSIHAKSNQTTQMMLGDHPIAGGLPEVIDLYRDQNNEMNMAEMAFGDLAVVGTAVDGNSTSGNAALIGADVTGFAMVVAIEAGDMVDPLGGTLDNTAPARRVMMPFSDNTLNFASDDVITLFSNAIDWAVGNLGGTTPLAITAFDLDSVSQPGNTIATLTFTSNQGQTYSIYTSDSLFDLSANDGDFVKTVVGGDGTTTVDVNFNVDGVPADSKRFFLVQLGAP